MQKMTFSGIETLESGIKKDGFFLSAIQPDELLKYAEQIIGQISSLKLDSNIIRSGYSQDISHLLTPDFKNYLSNLVKPLLRLKYFRKIMPFPRVVSIICSYSFFNDHAIKNTTHAHLWHRDLDDFGPQIKLFVPLTSCSEANGQFSALSTKFAGWADYLQDGQLVDRINLSNESEYVKSDARSRLTDKVLRSNVAPELIFDFSASVGEILFIDTNSTYHKGGLVLEDNSFRIMVQVTIGSITHSWYSPKTIWGATIKKVFWMYRSRFGKYVRIFKKRIPKKLS
jgi:hypothetical protein